MADTAEASCGSSAFSNGKDQTISNTNILNASGNITYIEWNPHIASRPQPGRESSLLLDLDTDTSHGTFNKTISEVQMPSDSTRPPITCISPPLEAVSGYSSRETAVSMTPINHTAFLSAEALQQAPSSCEVYVESMFPLKKGYPLFFPQPDQNLPLEYRRKGVSHGDIGIITSDGAFDFLFNIWYSAQDPINPSDLPEDFVSLPLSQSETLFQLVVNYEGHLSNMDIVSEENENTSGDKGSLLSLPHGAYQEDSKNQLDLKDFISRNAISWYSYALAKGRDIDRHSLCLVTGSIKSSSWGIATFDKSVPERNSMLVIGESLRTDRPSLKWKKTGGASSSRTGFHYQKKFGMVSGK
ncbi:hypothetical protein BDQ17DRAFT_1330780 [Cyathus striatus]|nr:hypothetical protein BDQ17DRAFT_1330780 [Cyathus striatus]